MNQSNPPVKKANRCAHCSCKLTGVKFECKCGKALCVKHLSALDHGCTFDYRANGLAALAKQLDTAGLGEKIAKI